MLVKLTTGFKNRGFHFSTKGFDENTFQIEDVFHDTTLTKLKNTTNYLVKELWSIFTGRCFTVCYLHNVNLDLNELYLKQTWDLKMYVHVRGEEFWLNFGDFPTEKSYMILDANNKDGLAIALMRLTETEKTDLNQGKLACKSYSESEHFADICKSNFWKRLKPQLNCTIASFKGLVSNENDIGHLQECDEKESAKMQYQVFRDFMSQFFTKPLNFDCHFPCQQTSYDIELDYFHVNTVMVPETDLDTIYIDGTLKFLYYYKTLSVQEMRENLVYDAGTFLAAAGGNLGLFLGLSCLTALFSFIYFVEKLVG